MEFRPSGKKFYQIYLSSCLFIFVLSLFFLSTSPIWGAAAVLLLIMIPFLVIKVVQKSVYKIVIDSENLVLTGLLSKKIVNLTKVKSIKLIGVYDRGLTFGPELIKMGIASWFDIGFINSDATDTWLKTVPGFTFQDIGKITDYLVENFPKIESINYDAKGALTRRLEPFKHYDFKEKIWVDNTQPVSTKTPVWLYIFAGVVFFLFALTIYFLFINPA